MIQVPLAKNIMSVNAAFIVSEVVGKRIKLGLVEWDC